MCTTYQAASGIIPIMAIFLALQLWNNKRKQRSNFNISYNSSFIFSRHHYFQIIHYGSNITRIDVSIR